MDFYEISEETLALVPETEETTKVYEKNKSFIVNMPIMKIIDDSCRYFGSSYKGRHEGTKSLIGVSHKSPIIIEESKMMIYFPTSSPRLKTCSWFALKYIKNYEKKNDNILITLENDTKLELDLSIGSFDNQYLRATKLESVLRKRKLLID